MSGACAQIWGVYPASFLSLGMVVVGFLVVAAAGLLRLYAQGEGRSEEDSGSLLRAVRYMLVAGLATDAWALLVLLLHTGGVL